MPADETGSTSPSGRACRSCAARMAPSSPSIGTETFADSAPIGDASGLGADPLHGRRSRFHRNESERSTCMDAQRRTRETGGAAMSLDRFYKDILSAQELTHPDGRPLYGYRLGKARLGQLRELLNESRSEER